MNYRHAFHAGNHTEVFKHAVLALLLRHLCRKPQPFAVLDTHAGAGLYDLTAAEARKTGEAERGVGRVFGRPLTVAAPYLDVVRKLNPDGLRRYPGSPAIARSFLRADDRLIVCERGEAEVAALRANFRDDRRVSVHARDGYEALNALLPPSQRRGLAFIDPPYEADDEVERLADALVLALRKWPSGMFAVWYPLTRRAVVQPLHRRLKAEAIPKCLTAELLLGPDDDERLSASGMVICKPPWQFESLVRRLGGELLTAFEAPKGHCRVAWVIDRA